MALNFDGASQYITIPHHNDFNFSNTFSIGGLFYFDTLGVFPTLIEKSGAYSIYAHVNGSMYVDFFASGFVAVLAGGSLSAMTWYQIYITYDSGRSLPLYTYVDNALLDQSVLGVPPINGNNIVVANSIPPYSAFMDGTQADLRFYNTTLSTVQVQNIYAHYIAGDYNDGETGGLVSRYLFSEKDPGQVANDGAGSIIDMTSGHDGTPTASPLYAIPKIVLAPPPTPTPANVAASQGTYTDHIRITWDEVVGATYTVYRATESGGALTDISGVIAIGTLFYDDYDIEPNTYYYYVVTATIGGSESVGSAEVAGFATPVLVHDLPVIKRPQVLILDEQIDLYDLGYVKNILKIKEQKTFRRDKLIDNEIRLKVKNFDNFFSCDNPVSVFKAINWLYEPFKIINSDGETIWEGILKDIERDTKTKTAEIISVNTLYKHQSTLIAYTSSAWETPADAFKNICDTYSFTDYDMKTVQDSINQYMAESCYIYCDFLLADNISLQQAMEKIAEIGCADCYMHKNKVHFKHWRPYTGGVKVLIEEKDLLDAPLIKYCDDEIFNDYSIGYDGDAGTSATDSNSNDIGAVSRAWLGSHILPDIEGKDNTQIKVKDKTSATYLGECYIRRTHIKLLTQPRRPYQVEFSVSGDFRYWLDLNTYFRLNLVDEEWDEKLFEVFETTIDYDKNYMTITAYEVEE